MSQPLPVALLQPPDWRFQRRGRSRVNVEPRVPSQPALGEVGEQVDLEVQSVQQFLAGVAKA